MAKDVLFGEKCREAVMRGVDLLADAVKITLGPGGRNVAISRRAQGLTPKLTKDGVTVANSIDPKNPHEQIGSDMVREAAQKTVEAAGDGTTTSTLLAQAMCRIGMQYILGGANPTSLKKGMDSVVSRLTASIRKMSIPIEGNMIFDVANISCNGDAEIAGIITQAINEVGKDGVMTVEESSSFETHLDVVSGLQLPSGFISPHFITDARRVECSYTDALVLLHEGKLTTFKSLQPLMRQVAAGSKPLLIIAGDYEQEAIATFVTNTVKGHAPLCAVKIPAWGARRREVLKDIAILTGGKAITEDSGEKIENVRLEDLGQVGKFIVSEFTTTLVDGVSTAECLEARVEEIRQAITSAEGDNKKHLELRLAGLLGGVAVIKVGAPTTTEMSEKTDRVDDAMHAARAAAQEGIVPGGGLALVRAAYESGCILHATESLGETLVLQACVEPLKQIAVNAGMDGDVILREVVTKRRKNYGYNARTHKFEDLIEAGVIDPTKVVIEALKNATSVAGNILNCMASTVDIGVHDDSTQR